MSNKNDLSQVTWPYYLHYMKQRFCNPDFLDPMYEPSRVRYITTVEDYYLEFESWLIVVRLPDAQALGLFLSNLKEDICSLVRLYKAQTLNSAFHLASQIEEVLYQIPKK